YLNYISFLDKKIPHATRAWGDARYPRDAKVGGGNSLLPVPWEAVPSFWPKQRPIPLPTVLDQNPFLEDDGSSLIQSRVSEFQMLLPSFYPPLKMK
ncbi:MAG TPA: hypothetical protein PLF70_02405, partial [Candidatus Portnoybacteria bacterium]|nr:hypothetical protein [Candidatus Portnoybacteria bacterium]